MKLVHGLVAGLLMSLLPAGPAGAKDTVDEIHYSYGDEPGTVVVHWRGAERSIAYGLTKAYGFAAVARSPKITPVDSPGPFREVMLTGLAPDTAYHYRIGDGADHVLRTVPIGSFRWVDIGDTAASTCKPWVRQTHQLIERLRPRFVTHGGDISEANVCGEAAVHRYYKDMQRWSAEAAFQPVWGNHEYGRPQPGAPKGTPRDTLANYKGRSFITNAGLVPTDTRSQVKAPGCGVRVNTCHGEDWGWFRAGGVLFISYPENWPGALTSWRRDATRLMARAAKDPTINFIVTYGHRPAYSSVALNGWDPTVRSALNRLAAKFSGPGGKYVLNLAHHVHALEVFGPVKGLTHVTNAAGGQGNIELPAPPAKGSLVRVSHLGVLAGEYDAAARRLTVRWVCGPSVPEPMKEEPCGYGDTVWSTSFQAGRDDPARKLAPAAARSAAPAAASGSPERHPGPGWRSRLPLWGCRSGTGYTCLLNPGPHTPSEMARG